MSWWVGMVVWGVSTTAHAAPACVIAESMSPDDLAAHVISLRIESRKQGLDLQWNTEGCGPNDPVLALADASHGDLMLLAGTVAVASTEGMLAADVANLLATEEQGVVPLLTESLLVAEEPPEPEETPSPRNRVGVGVALQSVVQRTNAFTGPVLFARHPLGRPWLELHGELGLGVVTSEEVKIEAGVVTPTASGNAYHLLAGLRAGPRWGPVSLRMGAGVGLRWQPVKQLDVVGLRADMEESGRSVEELDQDYLTYGTRGFPVLSANAEGRVNLTPWLRVVVAGGLESYMQLNESVDTSAAATVVDEQEPGSGVVAQLGLEILL